MMEEDKVHEIKSVTFGILSPKEIFGMSVAEITSTKLSGGSGTVYDDRMGVIENGKICETCGCTVKTCSGHFGHITLNEPIIHPLFYTEVRDMLICFCLKCFRSILSKEQLELDGIDKYSKTERFEKILDKLKKNDTCFHCGVVQPTYKYNPNDNTIQSMYKDKDVKIVYTLQVNEILKIFDNVSDDDVLLIGKDPKLVHPRNMIMTVFPVIPQACRPYVIADGNFCDDDLTNQILEIIKSNNHLRKDNASLTENKHQKYLQSLKFRISTFYDNSAQRAKHTTNGRAIKGLKERLTGKGGQMRSNLMGKRCLHSETRVLMWNGEIKKAKDIKVGESLIGDDGNKCGIVNICTGTATLFRVENIRTGESYTVNGNHLLSVYYPDNNIIRWSGGFFTFKKGVKYETGFWTLRWFEPSDGLFKILKITVDEYTTKEQAYQEIFDFSKKNNHTKYIDVSVYEYIYLPKDIKSLLFIYKLNVPINWGFDAEMTNIFSEITYCEVCEMTRIYDKVPDYLYTNSFFRIIRACNDPRIRFNMLSAVIDTSNSELSDNRKIIKLKNESILFLRDIKYLAESLGLNVEIKRNQQIQSNVRIYPNKYEMSIIGKLSHLNSKKFGNIMVDSPPVHDLFRILHEIDDGEYIGFEIDNETKRFLLAGFHVTHNCEQTGRTVIGPDPTLKMGQLAIPREIANNLTIPERVSKLNYDKMTNLVNKGGANYVLKNGGPTRINLKYALFRTGTDLVYGDEIVRVRYTPKTGEIDSEIVIKVKTGKEKLMPGDRIRRNGIFLEDVKYPEKKTYTLNIGDVVERRLQDGDWVLLNRQPTLHKASMQARQIIVSPHKTFRFNLSTTKAFNADFDGDEMNIHVAQSIEAQAELALLSASKNMLISAQSSKPNMAIVQDSLLGAYRMTLGTQNLRKDQFFDISMKTDLNTPQIMAKIQHIRRVLQQKGKKIQAFTGKGLVSLILPDTLIYEKKNGADHNEPTLKIYRGVLYEGALDKNALGAVHNSLLQIIYKEYGADATATFIDNIQFITNAWLMIDGFSIGLDDCMIKGKDQIDKIKNVIERCYIEAEGIKETTYHEGIREIRITSALSKAKDIGLKIAKDSLPENNNFLSTVKSGSKGDWFNVAQITGLLGQQNLLSQRVKPQLNNNTRTLPHYPFGKLPMKMDYESKGFITSPFIKGLNPREFYFHAMSGREGVCDTAMGTAKSGYIQRRIVKCTEDIKVQYDGTVRDTIGKIYQLSYNEDGFDPVNMVKVGNNLEMCDVSRIVDMLNMEHEIIDKKKKK